MSRQANLTALFHLDEPLPLASASSDVMDEVVITGIPATFPDEDLPTMILCEARERGYDMPIMLWFSKFIDKDEMEIQLLFQRPVDQGIMSDVIMNAVDDTLAKLCIDPEYAIEFHADNKYPEAIEYLKRQYPDMPRPSL